MIIKTIFSIASIALRSSCLLEHLELILPFDLSIKQPSSNHHHQHQHNAPTTCSQPQSLPNDSQTMTQQAKPSPCLASMSLTTHGKRESHPHEMGAKHWLPAVNSVALTLQKNKRDRLSRNLKSKTRLGSSSSYSPKTEAANLPKSRTSRGGLALARKSHGTWVALNWFLLFSQVSRNIFAMI